MIKVKSLAYQTDLFLLGFSGILRQEDGHIHIETPSNPSFFWGNLLYFPDAPQKGDVLRWTSLFKKAFTHQPEVKHMTFGWDRTDGFKGEVDEFLSQGFIVDHTNVLVGIQPKAPQKIPPKITVRPISTNEEWHAVTELQILVGKEQFREEHYRPFKETQMKNYKSMADQGLGDWYGAFLGDELVGNLGIFHQDGLGRYQAVQTHPDYRRQGICGTLVYETARYALEQLKLHTLVMVADWDSVPEKIYRSVGFEPQEQQIGIYRKDPAALLPGEES